MAIQPASAGTITFFDSTDAVTFTDDTGRITASTCKGETCTITLAPPDGAVTGYCPFDCNLFIAEAGGRVLISDEITGDVFVTGGIHAALSFTSDSETPLDMCGSTPLNFCHATEDGTVQDRIVIRWTNSAGTDLLPTP